MLNSTFNIVLMHGAKRCSHITAATLHACCADQPCASNSAAIFTSLAQRPADPLLADWLTPALHGQQLHNQLRQPDDTDCHYSCSALLSSQADSAAATEQSVYNTADFISKAPINVAVPQPHHATLQDCSAAVAA